MCSRGENVVVFDLIKAIFLKDVDNVVRLLKESLGQIEPLVLLKLLQRQVETLFAVKTFLQKGKLMATVEFLQLPAPVVFSMRDIIEKVPFATLMSIWKTLLELESESKSSKAVNIEFSILGIVESIRR